MMRKSRKPRVIDKEADYMLRWLEQAQINREHAEEEVLRGVVGCRQFGVSWARIARVIGMTAEGARKRFDVDEVEVLAQAMTAGSRRAVAPE